jgi:putative addiction module component (TIGR02574 family)
VGGGERQQEKENGTKEVHEAKGRREQGCEGARKPDVEAMNLPGPIEIEGGSNEVTEAEKRELDARWERFERDPSRALTIEQFRVLIEAKRGLSGENA